MWVDLTKNETKKQKIIIHDIWFVLRPYPGTYMKYRASC
jgi:hypothetical protein